MLWCNINFNSFVFLKIVWCEETHTGYTCVAFLQCASNCGIVCTFESFVHCHYLPYLKLDSMIVYIVHVCAVFFRCEKACVYLEFQLFWMICCIVHICHLSNISLPWMLRWVFRESSRPIDLSHFCIWISGKQKIAQRETQFCVE